VNNLSLIFLYLLSASREPFIREESQMLKHLILFIFLAGSGAILKAQDTIFMRSGEVIPAKVTEISPKEVKYKKLHMPDGPTYVQYKSDVRLIVYANGQKESFEEEAKKPEEQKKEISISDKTKPANTDNTDYYGGGYAYAPGNQVTAKGSLYIYQNKRISEKKLYLILNGTGDKQIIGLTGKAKDKHKLQYIGFAAFPVGIIALATYISATKYYPVTPGTAGPQRVRSINHGQQAVGVGLGLVAVACPVISIKAKVDRKRYNRQAVKLYNEKF
jgi:hypothetical protein